MKRAREVQRYVIIEHTDRDSRSDILDNFIKMERLAYVIQECGSNKGKLV